MAVNADSPLTAAVHCIVPIVQAARPPHPHDSICLENVVIPNLTGFQIDCVEGVSPPAVMTLNNQIVPNDGCIGSRALYSMSRGYRNCGMCQWCCSQ